ncbi:transglutaminase-like domain-containing protein [Flavobacterium sp. 7A]|uniref:transglutaminase-like domain-containing protein n=1 Tax=Flavobacterium sp. 7A TaxID=2940571 RepID=UPI002226705D|nr:transglutaminase family protein [Flavobacterium sp. 7A]MCW2119691.1 transglutaminase-like putative cysteine protease [Flavobacterium sp. 7A]
MKFNVHSEITYNVAFPTTFIFNIHAIRNNSQQILTESLVLNPQLEVEEFSYNAGAGRFLRLKSLGNTSFTISYDATVETNYTIYDQRQEFQNVPVSELDGDIIPFLFPSRYCQSDKLQKLAYKEFGGIENIYSRVLAITDWIHNNVEYVSGSTDSQTSALDTITDRVGVCRDFAHLGISLCRALSIPARYLTCYAYTLQPPDFHACFEAYIGGNWIVFDATQLVPLNSLVKIANGRDAADAAVASIFGNASSSKIIVSCELAEDNFTPFWYNENVLNGFSIQ